MLVDSKLVNKYIYIYICNNKNLITYYISWIWNRRLLTLIEYYDFFSFLRLKMIQHHILILPWGWFNTENRNVETLAEY